MPAVQISKKLYEELKPLTNDKENYDPEKVSFADLIESAWEDAAKYREAKRTKKALK